MPGTDSNPEALQRRLDEAESLLAASRREAEALKAALALSEDKLHHVLNLAGDGLWEWQLEDDLWLASARCFEMLGHAPEEAASDRSFWASQIHPDDRDRVLQAMAAARANGDGLDIEFRLRAKDGSLRWVRSQGRPFHGDTPGEAARIVGLQSDMTEQKHAASEIAMKTAALENALYGFDIVGGDGTFRYANRAYLDMWGYENEAEILGTSPASHCADPDMPGRIIEQVRREGSASFEFTARRKDGSTFDVQMAVCLYHDEDGGELFTGTSLDITGPRHAQQHLRRIAEMLSRTERIARVGSWEWDHKTDSVRWSEGMFQILGLDPAAGAPPFATHESLFAPGEFERLKSEVDRVLRDGGGFEIELTALHADGTPIRCMSIGEAETGPGGGVVRLYGSFQDISHLRRLEHDLRSTEQRYNYLYTMSRDGIARADLDGRLLEFNVAYQQMLGYSPEELRTLTYHQITPPRWREGERERIQAQTFTRGYTDLYEKEYIRKDGTIINVELQTYLERAPDGAPAAVWATVRDITLRRRAEEALRKSEERFRSFVENAHDIIFALTPDGRIEYVSPNWLAFFGEPPEAALGKPFQNYLLLEDIPKTESFMAAAISEGAPRSIPDVRVYHYDRSIHWYAVNASPLLDEHGNVQSIVGISRDVTRERLLEREYRQSQKMEAIGHLTGGVAHDFNNLLQVINGSTELALERTDNPEFVHKMLSEVAGAGERAARLVRQLLLFSRRQIMRPETLDMNNVVDDLLKLLRRVIEEHIRLEWVPGRHLGAIRADRSMMEQALMNLCVNARDAMPERGVLTIESQNVLIDSQFCETHAWARTGRYVLVCVTDTGHGMSTEVCEHMFEPFFTTKGEGQGTGLGLATVYGIVTQHEGMITAYSEVGTGTTFKVYLPVCERPAQDVGTLIQGRAVGGSETILLVEDDAMVRELTRKFLETANYNVIAAENGAIALEIFKRDPNAIQLAVLDVVMPVMGGREAFDHMREIRPGMPALFASGYSENAVHTNFVLDEDLQLIQKPFLRDDLLRAVRSMLDHAAE
jgi:PAS domain S-box-containing protein